MSSEHPLSKAPKCRVLVVGDVMLDRYVSGDVTRVSPEDPTCLVLDHEPPVERRLGGAANVACNVVALGASVDMIGLGGDRKFRDQFRATIKAETANYPDKLRYDLTGGSRRFTVKTRYCAHGKQLLRVDYEEKRAPSTVELEELKQLYRDIAEQPAEPAPDIAILSDYGKGTLLGDFLPWLIDRLQRDSIKYVVDPKRVDVEAYGSALAICPNKQEWAQICHAGHTAKSTHVVVTEGEHGCTLMPWRDGRRLSDACISEFPVKPAEISDPTGAGDTFIAALALTLACGQQIDTACAVANAAARLAVMHEGTTAVTLEELEGDI